MYSEGSEFLPQNNETALQYFKKASDLVRITLLTKLGNLFTLSLLTHSQLNSVTLSLNINMQ